MTQHKIKIDMDELNEAQTKGQEKLPEILSLKSTMYNTMSNEWSYDIYVINPSIQGTVQYEHLLNGESIPTEKNKKMIKDIKVDLIERTIEGEKLVSTTKTDENGKFKFSNIDGKIFKLNNSSNDLIIKIDDENYNIWTFHENVAEKIDKNNSNIGRITDISRYQDDFESIMENVKFRDEFEEIREEGKRALNFKVILTDKLGEVEVNYLDEKGNPISKRDIMEGSVGTEYQTMAKDIPRYNLLKIEGDSEKGNFIKGKLVVNYIYTKNENKNGLIIINYLDDLKNKISDSKTISGKIGSEYITVAKNIRGYRLLKIEGASEKGKFTNGELVINYIYKKEITQKGSVSVNYLDEDGRKIADKEILYGNVGEIYRTEEKKIRDYEFLRVKGNRVGNFIDGELVVDYVYKKIDNRKKPEIPEEKKRKDTGKKLIEKLDKENHFEYIQGYPDKTVKPEGYITREEVAAVFYRLLTENYKSSIFSIDNSFRDVEKLRWSNKHISTLSRGDILEGYNDGKFRPENNITRAEVAAVASRFDSLSSVKSQFTDVDGHWAEDYIGSANDKGWIKGYPDGKFKPDEYITRAEFVTLVNNVLERKVYKYNLLNGIKQFEDLKEDKWYYEAIVEASNGHMYNKKSNLEVWTELREFNLDM